MKWQLIALVLGTTPVPTGITFDTLSDCMETVRAMRKEYSAERSRPLKQTVPKMPWAAPQVNESEGVCIPAAK